MKLIKVIKLHQNCQFFTKNVKNIQKIFSDESTYFAISGKKLECLVVGLVEGLVEDLVEGFKEDRWRMVEGLSGGYYGGLRRVLWRVLRRYLWVGEGVGTFKNVLS